MMYGLQNVINLQVSPVEGCVKIDDTVPGVEEGLNAGMWSIGLAMSGNELDLYTHHATQEQDNTPFTPAVQVLCAMEQALAELETEGVARRIERYAENARVLRAGMGWLGFEILVAAGARSNILTTFRLLPGLGYDPLHDAMKRRGYIIYAGQGDIRTYAFRVSNMGTLTPADMRGVVEAFAASLDELGCRAA
ncbi:MAG: hypothetical protein HYY95_05775 [Candidatus Rokubacteria bacterium]|nr:hypothetical protein [Candidatus Rokubacteria bacterium]